MTGTGYGVLAGYDGSAGSKQALSWAAREARARGAVLTVCQAWVPAHQVTPAAGAAFELARRNAEQALARGVRRAQAVESGEVRPLLADGSAAVVLCEHSTDAEMVVVGSRGHGGLTGLLLGSVSSQVAAHARGRIVVVRGRWRHAAGHLPGPVVAGADGSAASQAAVAFALEEAALRAAPLLVVCAMADAPGRFGGGHQIEDDFEQWIALGEKEHPGVAVQRQVTCGPPHAALLAAASDAQMLVVGSRGRGGVRGMMLGSVSQAVLHDAPCPVGIVHPQ
jgi:nucleotide-binding universal stress UspA family protein